MKTPVFKRGSTNQNVSMAQPANADDAPCLKCSDIVNRNSKALQCDLCTGWVHISCADVCVKAYTTLQSMKGSMWLCENCQNEFPNLPKKITTLADENSALALQLEELSYLPKVVKDMQRKMETLSEELDSIKGRNGWAVQRKRNHSSPLPMTYLETTNRFAFLASNETPNLVDPPTPPSPLRRVRFTDNQGESIASQTSTPSMETINRNSLFYLRAIPRDTKFEEVKAKLTSFGVSAQTLSLPPTLSTQSRRMYVHDTVTLHR